MMLGVELVSDRELKTPAQNETLHVMDQMKELGVLIGKGGYYGNVFRITPKKMQTSLWMRWTTHFPSVNKSLFYIIMLSKLCLVNVWFCAGATKITFFMWISGGYKEL
ncbi:hypothetical protein GLYMA_09G278300v4 [Glycine max]|nr:hypothetical protein GLYMA_09G278300v4 [Glycine max]